MTFYVYVMQCSDGTFYTGYTSDMEKRLAAHDSGTASKYTARRLPVKIVAKWAFGSRREAMRAEYAFKQLPRKEKLARISRCAR
jgi:putative endonuclease